MKFDKVHFYHRVLSQQEMTDIYNGKEVECGCDICKWMDNKK